MDVSWGEKAFNWLYNEDTAKINEIWHQKEGEFTPFKVFDHAYDAKTYNIDFLRIKKCQTEGCNVSDFYPQFFDYCPSCGDMLIPAIKPSVPLWASPYGNPDGSRSLPTLRWNLSADGSNKESMFLLPKDGGNFTFLVTEEVRTLIAIDRVPGRPKMRVFSYSIAMGDWILHDESIPNFIGPPWAWSAASGPDGFALPTKEGPCWVSLSESGDNFLHDLAIEKYKNCRSVGGAGVCSSIALVPIEYEEGLAIAWRICAADTSWMIAPIVNKDTVEIKSGFFGAAAQDGVNTVFWCGERGYLSVYIDKGVPQGKWHSWNAGYEGRPQFMPYRDRFSVLWQLCFNKEEGYCFNQLSHEGIHDQRRVCGPHFTIGNKSFYDDKLYEEPWSDESLDYYPGHGQEYFIQPLIQLSSGLLYIVARNINKILEYIDPQKTVKYPAELSIRKNEGGDVKLKEGFSITSPWDAEAFLFSGGLYLYIGNQNKCWIWPNIYEKVIS